MTYRTKLCTPGEALDHMLGGGMARVVDWRPGRYVKIKRIDKHVSDVLTEVETCIINECGMPRKASRLLGEGWEIVVEDES